MENHIEKKMEHEMDTGIIGFIGGIFMVYRGNMKG